MLTIRLQRTGRSGHAQFRLIAQDRRFSPLSGRVVAYLGSYDPHTKKASLDSQKIEDYLSKGARPSPRAIKLLEKEGMKLPAWVAKPAQKQRAVRNPEKLRKNQPKAAEAPATEARKEEPAPLAEEKPAPPEKAPEEPTTTEVPAESEAEADKPAEDTPTEEKPADTEPKS